MLTACRMGNIMDKISKNLANNITNFRKKQGLSQVQLAKRAEVPRSTLTYLESGQSNPSLQNLVKISSALQISVEELLSPPQTNIKLIKSQDVPIQNKSRNRVQVEKLLPDPIPGMEIDRITLEPGSRLKGTPHIDRTKEYLYCSKGVVNTYVDKSLFALSEGDVLAFPGDEPHAYENPHRSKKAICFSVVIFAPLEFRLQ